MPSWKQGLFPGRLQKSYQRELRRLIDDKILDRLWAKDSSLWPIESERQEKELAAHFTWLDLPERIGPYMSRVAGLADLTEKQGFQDVVFVAMGDSNLAAETMARASSQLRCRRIFILDSTDPAAIRAIDQELDFEVTLFVFANKSGKRIENHALLLYFLDRLKAHGRTEPGRCFIAVTEEGSYLASNARSYGFLGTFLDPPGIKGRFSSLIHFGLMASAIWRCDTAEFLSRVLTMRDICRRSTLPDSNPALALAAFLATGALEGHDKLFLLATSSLDAGTYRIAQLVGTSMSKNGKGLVPVCDVFAPPLEVFEAGAMGVTLSMGGDDDSGIRNAEERFKQAGAPLVSVELSSPLDLGAGFFKWELATALACALTGVNPFDEPDVQPGKERAAELLETIAVKGALPAKTIRVSENGIDLYAEGETRYEISTLSLADSLRTFFDLRQHEGYLAIITFLGNHPHVHEALGRLRERLAQKLGIPVLLSTGPRYLHYFEQVYKGGPPKGQFIFLTADAIEDLAIPGAGYTFGQLQLALALADFESLVSAQKFALRLHLTGGLEQGLTELQRAAQQALEHMRTSRR